MVPFLINSIINNFLLVSQNQKVLRRNQICLPHSPERKAVEWFHNGAFCRSCFLSYSLSEIHSTFANDDYNKQCTKENDDEKNNIKCSLEGLTPRKKKKRRKNRCDVKYTHS